MKPLCLCILVACASSQTSSPPASERLVDLQYAPLSGWNHKDVHELARDVSRWTPDENPNKETISIFRTRIRDAVKVAAPARLEELLAQAQLTLPTPAVSQPRMGTTKQHLAEVEITADYIPRGLQTSYHRMHAMIIDHDVLIHVLYTARTPDLDHRAFDQTVDSIHLAQDKP